MGRQILDPIVIASELFDDYITIKEKGWVFKLDFEKAFDMVDWDFLLEVLNCKGFGACWTSWIKASITNTSFFIMINGRPRCQIRATRGLRQGDPLAPFPLRVGGRCL